MCGTKTKALGKEDAFLLGKIKSAFQPAHVEYFFQLGGECVLLFFYTNFCTSSAQSPHKMTSKKNYSKLLTMIVFTANVVASFILILYPKLPPCRHESLCRYLPDEGSIIVSQDPQAMLQTDGDDASQPSLSSVDPGFPFCLIPMSFALRVTNSPVQLIHVTLAELVYRARKAHTISLSSFSCFPVVAPSNHLFSLLFTHLLQLFVPANSSSKLCLLIEKIILCFSNYWLHSLVVVI